MKWLQRLFTPSPVHGQAGFDRGYANTRDLIRKGLDGEAFDALWINCDRPLDDYDRGCLEALSELHRSVDLAPSNHDLAPGEPHPMTLPPQIIALLAVTDDDGMECFEEGDGPYHNAERAERLGLLSISSWRGGWQYRLTDAGLGEREKILGRPSGERP